MPVPFEIQAASEIHTSYLDARSRQDKKKMDEAAAALEQLLKEANIENIRAQAAGHQQDTKHKAELHPGIKRKGVADAESREADVTKQQAELPYDEINADNRRLTASALNDILSTPGMLEKVGATETFKILLQFYEMYNKYDYERKIKEEGGGDAAADAKVTTDKTTTAKGKQEQRQIDITSKRPGEIPSDDDLTIDEQQALAEAAEIIQNARVLESNANKIVRENDFEKRVLDRLEADGHDRVETEAKLRRLKDESKIMLHNIRIDPETGEFMGVLTVDADGRAYLDKTVNVPGDMIEMVKPVWTNKLARDSQAYLQYIQSRRADQTDLDRELKERIAKATKDQNEVKAKLDGAADEFQRATILRKELIKHSEPFLAIRHAYNTVLQGYNERDSQGRISPAGTVSMIMGLMRILDPTSVVRESEYDRYRDLGDMYQLVQAKFAKFMKGELIHEEVRQDIMDIAQDLFDNELIHQRRFEDDYKKLTETANVNWDLVKLESMSADEADKELRDTTGAYQYYERQYRFRHDWGRIENVVKDTMIEIMRLEDDDDLITTKSWLDFVRAEDGTSINNEQRRLIYKKIDQFVELRDGMIAYEANNNITFGKGENGLDIDTIIEQELVDWVRDASQSEIAYPDSKAIEKAIERIIMKADRMKSEEIIWLLLEKD